LTSFQLFYNSFSYAGTFVTGTTQTPQQNSYVLSSYFLPSDAPAVPYSGQAEPSNGHTTALREAFIENWKSENFCRFVEACRAMVDELAMAQATGNGRTEMLACERVFKQAVWLWGQIFPDVIVMGRQDDLDDEQDTRDDGNNSAMDGSGSADEPVGVDNGDNAHASAT
jgi:hypothetical protein